jgi:o-succinylbenzoate synthase
MRCPFVRGSAYGRVATPPPPARSGPTLGGVPALAPSNSGPPFGYLPQLAGVPDLDPRDLHVYAVPMVERFRGITVREGVVLRGPVGWGEFCPFTEYDDEVAVPWLATALEAAWLGWPRPVRQRVEVNATVPAVGPERAAAIVRASGARTAKVKVADTEQSGAAGDERTRAIGLDMDAERVAAVRDALGPGGHVRVDANARWDVDTAVRALEVLDAAAGGLQYAEQPCATVAELAQVRERTHVPIAADESIRRAEDPLAVAVAKAADVAVVKCTPLGGVRRALAVASAVEDAAGMPVVVSSALETGVGLAAELALAGALPRLELACGLGTLALLAGDVAPAAPPAGPGQLLVPAGPPAPDPELLERHALRDPDRVRWWRERTLRTQARLRALLRGSGPFSRS